MRVEQKLLANRPPIACSTLHMRDESVTESAAIGARRAIFGCGCGKCASGSSAAERGPSVLQDWRLEVLA